MKRLTELFNLTRKVLYIILGFIIISFSILSAFKLKVQIVDIDYNYENYVKDKHNLELWNKYYYYTETLLDSIGVECNDTIFSTYIGKRYLLYKDSIDKNFNY